MHRFLFLLCLIQLTSTYKIDDTDRIIQYSPPTNWKSYYASDGDIDSNFLYNQTL
jgi:hypothetical protein